MSRTTNEQTEPPKEGDTMKKLALTIALLLAATGAWALTPQEGELAKNSDAYLQSVLRLDRFQRSECGCVFPKRNFPTLDTVWMTEVGSNKQGHSTFPN